MAQRRKCERVLGPYCRRGKWRVVVVSDGGARTYRDYETKTEATKVIASLDREIERAQEQTVGEAQREYMSYLREEKQNKPRSIADTGWRLGQFFVEIDADRKVVVRPEEMHLSSITPKAAQQLYDSLRTRKTERGQQFSVDSHRNILAEAKTFLGWCAGKKWIRQNPLEHVQGVGKRRHGKEQLRIAEARRWIGTAIEYADNGEAGAVAALTSLLMGMRASEIITRLVRDLDDEGRLLWIPETKTEAGRRRLQVPELLRPYLVSLGEDKGPHDLLFGQHWRDWPREWVQRICDKAKVPKVTAHGMRGLHSTLAVDIGMTGQAVATALGHESSKTTYQSYVHPSAAAHSQQRKVLGTLMGGSA